MVLQMQMSMILQIDNVTDIIHISHGFEGDIPEYQPRGDTKALARYITRCRSDIKNKNKMK